MAAEKEEQLNTSPMYFKTKISKINIIWILAVSLVISQAHSFIHADFFNKKSWIFSLFLVLYAVLFNLLFVWSFEISSSYLKVNYCLFFRKSKIYNLSEIKFIEGVNFHGKGAIPFLKIKLKERSFTHYFLLIDGKSINKLASMIATNGINSKIFTNYCEFKKYGKD